MTADLVDQVRAERAAQGLPERLEDPEAVSAAASILLATTTGRALLAGGEGRHAA